MIKLYTDGACRGNPGNGACAWQLVKEDLSVMAARSVYLGHCTNNIAEYSAILYGLISILMSDIKSLTVVSDSELVVKQLNGTYKCNKPELNFYKTQIEHLIKTNFKSVKFMNVPRENIFIIDCDKLCNETLDKVIKK